MLMLAPNNAEYDPADEERVIAQAVERHLVNLDQNFLAVVEAYETQAMEAGLEMRKLIRKVKTFLFFLDRPEAQLSWLYI